MADLMVGWIAFALIVAFVLIVAFTTPTSAGNEKLDYKIPPPKGD
jgi:hypothetical protein